MISAKTFGSIFILCTPPLLPTHGSLSPAIQCSKIFVVFISNMFSLRAEQRYTQSSHTHARTFRQVRISNSLLWLITDLLNRTENKAMSDLYIGKYFIINCSFGLDIQLVPLAARTGIGKVSKALNTL